MLRYYLEYAPCCIACQKCCWKFACVETAIRYWYTPYPRRYARLWATTDDAYVITSTEGRRIIFQILTYSLSFIEGGGYLPMTASKKGMSRQEEGVEIGVAK